MDKKKDLLSSHSHIKELSMFGKNVYKEDMFINMEMSQTKIL